MDLLTFLYLPPFLQTFHLVYSLQPQPSSRIPISFQFLQSTFALASRNSTFQPFSYVDYYKCVNAKGEEFTPCKQFFRAYHSLCPSAYYDSDTSW